MILTPEAARELGNALARYLNQHDVTTGRAVERGRVSRSGTPAERAMWEGLDGGRDQRDLWQLRTEAEAKIRELALTPKLSGPQPGMNERLVQADMDVSKANRRSSALERDLEVAQARLAQGLGAAAFEHALSLICQPQRTRDGALSWSQPSEEQMRYVHAWVGFVAEKCMPEAVEETVTPRVVQAVKKTTESTRQVSWVSSDGTVLLPQRIRERLEVGQGGEVAFLTNHLTGRVEILSERDFLDLLGPDPGCTSIGEPTAKQIASLARGMYEAYAAELGWRRPDDRELLRRWSVKDVIAVGEPLIFGGPKAYAMDDGSSAGESERNAWHRLAIEARGLNLIGGTEMTRELATRLYLVYVDYLGGVSTYAPHEPLVPWDDLFEISQRAWLKAALYARDHVRCTCHSS